MKIGIDYDDTYTENPKFFDSLGGDKIIITGRPKSEFKQLQGRLPDYKIEMFPTDWPAGEVLESDEIVKALGEIAEWKAGTAKKHGVDVFFENDFQHARKIKEKNPNCLVLMVI